MQWSKAAFFGFIEFSHDISSTKIDIPMNEQTSKSIVCHCRSAPVFQTSHSRKIPFTGHGPYRHCEQNPKTSMQIRIIVRVCKFNCFFQRLIESCFWSPAQNIFHFTISAINPIESGKSSSYLACISSTCSADMSWTRLGSNWNAKKDGRVCSGNLSFSSLKQWSTKGKKAFIL